MWDDEEWERSIDLWRSFALLQREVIWKNQKVKRDLDEFFRKLHAIPPTASSGISISYHRSQLSSILFFPAHKPNCNAQSRQVHIGLSKRTRSARMWLMTSAGCCSIGSNYSENNFKRSFRGFWTRNALSSLRCFSSHGNWTLPDLFQCALVERLF